MNRTQTTSQPSFSPDDIRKALTNALPGVDQARAKGLEHLGVARDAKARSLAREQTLLARKHASTGHPRIAIAQAQFKANETFRREIAVVHELAETPAPEVKDDTFVVHGFVRRRSDHAGLPGLTLALTDEEGDWHRELGFACTDKRGYFRLDATAGPAPDEGKKQRQDIATDLESGAGMNVESARREGEARAARQAAGAARQESTAQAGDVKGSRAAAARKAQLRVFDSKGHVLHVEPRPVHVRGGAIDYRYIVLGDEEAACACVPPPEKSGGRPAATGPKAPANVPPPAPSPSGAESQPAARVGSLKAYTQPSKDDLALERLPLEAIRGIGPKTGEKLRQAGIADAGDYARTRGSELVKVAGLDKTREKPKPAEGAHGTPAKREHSHKPAVKKPRKKE